MTAPSSEQVVRNEETARAVFRGILESDYTLMRSCFSDDAVCWIPRSGARVGIDRKVSADGFVAGAKSMEGTLLHDGMEWNHRRVHGDDDYVWVLSTMSCTTSSGDPYENDYCFVFRFGDSKIVEAWEFVDTAYTYDLLGL